MAVYLGSNRVGTTIEKEYLGIPLELSATGVLKKPTTPFAWKSQGSDVADYSMQTAFRGCTGLTSVDLSSLTTVSGSSAMYEAFYTCTRLTSVDLSSLTTVSGSDAMYDAFRGCTGLTSVDLSSLTTVSGSSAMYYAFRGCTKLKTLSFPALTSNSFGSYTNQFNSMLSGVTGCTVHFPSNLQSVIGNWSSVTSGFGGTNTTVLFDLSATT